MIAALALLPLFALTTFGPDETNELVAEVMVGPSSFKLMYPAPNEPDTVFVAAFLFDASPVTNAAFLAFVRANPEWRSDRIAPVRADEAYLSQWLSPEELGPPGPHNGPDQPVTRVSWYAAKAYCKALGKRLPTEHEWELAAAADETRVDARQDPEFQGRVLTWYSRPNSAGLPDVGNGVPNKWGARDLHGLVWEWVSDFNNTMVTGDSREKDSPDKTLFCGAGTLAAADGGDYASFMRYAMRSSLAGRFTTRNLGFRCAHTPNTTPRKGLERR